MRGAIERCVSFTMKMRTLPAGVIIATGFVALTYSGFCIWKFSFLSDRTAIEAAINDVRQLAVHIVEGPPGQYRQFSVKRPKIFQSVDEFEKNNPDCCRIVPHDPVWVDLSHKLFGWAAKSVFVKYTVRYIDDDGSVREREAVAQRPVGNCGLVLNTGR